MGIIIKSPREIASIKEAGKILIELFDVLEAHTKPGISTWELDKIAERFIRSKGAIPSAKGYGGFPGAICISVNDVLIHGIPSRRVILKEGDIVSYDCMATLRGYVADACRTFPVGEISPSAKKLIETTKKAFFEGVKLVKPGIHLGDVSHAIEICAKSEGFTLTSDYTGHGVGCKVHEDPYVPNVGKPGSGPILQKGMVIAIEPMVNEGKVELIVDDDEWTVRTKDGKLSAHYENTVAVTDTGYEILTLKEEEGN